MQNNLFRKIQEREISLRATGLLILLVVLIGLVTSNILHVVISASENYQVYVAEQQGLEELKAQYEQLNKELAYYKSYDYKELYARDNLKMVTPDEKLYKLNSPEKIYSVIDQQKELVKSEDNMFWWNTLLRATFGV